MQRCDRLCALSLASRAFLRALWERSSSSGRPYPVAQSIHTWTVVTHPVHPAAVDKVPYVVVIVELEEQAGLTMVSNLIDCDIEAIKLSGILCAWILWRTRMGKNYPCFARKVSE